MDLDFKQLFPDHGNRFFQEWPSWADKFLTAALEKAKREKKKASTLDRFKINAGKYFQRIMFHSPNVQLYVLDSPSFDLRALEALFFYMSKKNEPKLLEPLFRFINYGTNVMDTVKEIAAEYKKDFHPLMLVATTGPNEIPFRYYVSVFDMVYTFESFSSALDILFKSFFALNVDYPAKIKTVYTFLQQFIYGIYIKGDGKYGPVINLIDRLDRTRLASENKTVYYYMNKNTTDV